MHPKTFEIYQQIKARDPKSQALQFLNGAHHFDVPYSVCKVAAEMAQYYGKGENLNDLCSPSDARPPARDVALSLNARNEHLGTYLVGLRDDASSIIDVAILSSEGAVDLGWYEPGTVKGGLSAKHKSPVDLGVAMLLVCFILSLINTPRLVIHEHKTLPRQQRRSMERTIGQPALGYTEVRWTIGKSIKARQSDGSPMRGMPLHWNRAHWRKANEGEPKAEWRSSGPHGAGWYCWASDYYAGHPDFGVKLQMHAPRMLGEERRPGAVAPHAALSPDRLAVMNEQKRAALIAAGYGDTPQ